MPSQPDMIAPAEMAAEVGALCTHVRRDADCLYGRLLRENVTDALRCSFPEFSQQLGSARLEEAASAFLAEHPAARPQFHHIATGFVEFAQQSLALSQGLLSLLEYEWLLLSVEIDPAGVPMPSITESAIEGVSSLEMNPTARFVVLPFDVTYRGRSTGTGEECCAHAIYRTSGHSVVTRRLTYKDCLLIDRIHDAGRLHLGALLTSASNHFPEKEVRQWVADAVVCDLLHLASDDLERLP